VYYYEKRNEAGKVRFAWPRQWDAKITLQEGREKGKREDRPGEKIPVNCQYKRNVGIWDGGGGRPSTQTFEKRGHSVGVNKGVLKETNPRIPRGLGTCEKQGLNRQFCKKEFDDGTHREKGV